MNISALSISFVLGEFPFIQMPISEQNNALTVAFVVLNLANVQFVIA